MNNEIFEQWESNVRSYSRKWEMTFTHGKDATLIDEDGNHYIDFFAGAGALNFGHNNKYIKDAILEYLSEDRIIHALDMNTEAKKEFLKTFSEKALTPRGLDYKIMSCGPTGTNAVEAALKLARKNKKRMNIFAFSGAFHGMSLGSLTLTSDRFSREGAGVPLNYSTFMPYFNAFEDPMVSIQYIENVLNDDHSGIEKPAAIILETIQAEGGINVAPVEWLQALRKLCDDHDILMIIDDIQVGIGRAGSFFSFERANIVPDMVILSKSISGLAVPLSLLLIKRELDIFNPAEHNGTFRGNQMAFVGCKAAIEYYHDHDFDGMVKEKAEIIKDYLTKEVASIDPRIKIRGTGMIWGIDVTDIDGGIAEAIQKECINRSLVLERAGRGDQVVKLMPPLVIDKEMLIEGLTIVKESIMSVLDSK